MTSDDESLNILNWVRPHIDRIQTVLPSQLALSVGLYAYKSLMGSGKFVGSDTPTLLQVVHRKEMELMNASAEDNGRQIIVLDTTFEPHYWFDIQRYLEKEPSFMEALKDRIFDYHEELVAVGSLSEGVAAGVFPTINEYLLERGSDYLLMGVFPSLGHSSDALFNAFSSLGQILIQGSGPIVILDRDRLDSFISVNRAGARLLGDDVPRYLAELFLDKKGIVRDLAKLSQAFKVELFTALMASGSSMEIYESLRNVLDVTLEQPLLDFDLSTISLVYVLIRAPLRMQEQFTKGYIELEVNDWLKETLGLNVPQICEPVYVDEFNDRVDVIILVGGFDPQPLFKKVDERITRFDNLIKEHGFYDREVWDKIRQRLVNGQTKLG